jgi:hypothetical protein
MLNSGARNAGLLNIGLIKRKCVDVTAIGFHIEEVLDVVFTTLIVRIIFINSKVIVMVKLRKRKSGSYINYMLSDNEGREAILTLYPFTNRKDFALVVREAKQMIRQQVGFYR